MDRSNGKTRKKT